MKAKLNYEKIIQSALTEKTLRHGIKHIIKQSRQPPVTNSAAKSHQIDLQFENQLTKATASELKHNHKFDEDEARSPIC